MTNKAEQIIKALESLGLVLRQPRPRIALTVGLDGEKGPERHRFTVEPDGEVRLEPADYIDPPGGPALAGKAWENPYPAYTPGEGAHVEGPGYDYIDPPGASDDGSRMGALRGAARAALLGMRAAIDGEPRPEHAHPMPQDEPPMGPCRGAARAVLNRLLVAVDPPAEPGSDRHVRECFGPTRRGGRR